MVISYSSHKALSALCFICGAPPHTPFEAHYDRASSYNLTRD